ncbi:TonB-dependent receptor domain-containing protein [Phenylobacterium sp.]|uniref:TonB-dependent receptor domain-containing protein n=1 Tax=Phenylobacterium sp. TaxID=1871053 RepID=UPI0035AE2F08
MAAAVAALAGQAARAADRTPYFNIAAGAPLEEALTAFSEQADQDILFQPGLVAGARTGGVRGARSPAAALAELLSGTGLTWREAHGRLLIERKAAEAPGTAAPSSTLDVLVVTATRRPTLEQLTPMSVRALPGEELTQAGVTTFGEASALVPGFNYVAVGAGRHRISLRGVHASGEATTALYYDEVPVTGPSGTTADPGAGAPELLLVDLDRIEVLRGPQGTLYGAGAMGGALRVMFRRPNLVEAGAEVTGEVEQADGGVGHTAVGVLNAPLPKGRAAARLTVYRREEPGYIDNRRLALSDVNGSQIRGVRLGVAAEPASSLRLSLTSAVQVSDFEDTAAGAREGAPLVSLNPVRTEFRSRLALHQAQLRLLSRRIEVTANAAVYDWRTTRQSDYTGVLLAERTSGTACARYFAGAACGADMLAAYSAYVDDRAPGMLNQPDSMQAQVQELRLQSAGSGFTAWTVGVFREAREDTIDSQVLVADAATGRPRPDLGYTGRRLVANALRQRAIYGEATIGADRATSLTIGARRFDYERRTVGQVLVANVISNTTNANFETEADEDGWSLKVLASRRIGPSLLAYAQASQGFRPGGINTVPELPPALAAYEADSVWNYEAGVKMASPDNRASLNAAAYRVDWRNMQFSATSANGAFGFITNVGRAQIDGFELDAAVAFEAGRAGVNLNLSRAELVDDQAAAEAIGLGSAGDRLPFVPRLAFNLWGEYRPPPFGALDLLLRADVAYVGRSHSTFRPGAANDTSLGDLWLVNLRATAGRDAWRLGAYVENLLDSHKPTAATTGATPQPYPTAPRHLGVTATYRF